MRIQHNIMAMNANRNLGMNNTALSKNLEKLSSGYRINRAGDDAAGLAISEKMRADVAIYDQAINNANDGIAMIQTAEGALQEVHDMLNRMETLYTQAANDTYGAEERSQIKAELDQLKTEIDRIQDETKFNGITLFDKGGAINFQVGANASGSTGNTIAMANINSVAVTVAATLTHANSVQGINDIKDLIETVSTRRGTLGALQNRLEHTVENLGVTMENLQNAESRVRDTDVAKEMMAYTKNNILIQSAQAMLAQANQVPQGVLQLMQ